MTDPAARPFPDGHPLLKDRARFDALTNKMWWAIQMVLGHHRSRRPLPGRPGGPELTLIGGTSARDIYQDAMIDLLRCSGEPNTTWEALGVRIAQNKAKDALRRSWAGRRRKGEKDIEIASLDVANAEGEPLVDGLPAPLDVETTIEEAQNEVRRLERQQALHDIAEEVLDDRERQIIFRIQRGETKAAIGRDLDLTGQRIGQIYPKLLKKLHQRLGDDPRFGPSPTDPIEGGIPHDG